MVTFIDKRTLFTILIASMVIGAPMLYAAEGKEHRYKVILIGDTGVGKTCLFNSILGDKFGETLATATPDKIRKTFSEDNRRVTIDLWDTGGQEQFARLTRSAFANVDTVILCCDVNERPSQESCKERWRREMKDYLNEEKVKVLILCGTKCDLGEGESGFSRAIEGLRTFFSQANLGFKDIYTVETSAKEGTNIRQLIKILASSLLLYEPRKYGEKYFKKGDHVWLVDAPHRGKRAEVVSTFENSFEVRLAEGGAKYMVRKNFGQIALVKEGVSPTNSAGGIVLSGENVRGSSASNSVRTGCCWS